MAIEKRNGVDFDTELGGAVLWHGTPQDAKPGDDDVSEVPATHEETSLIGLPILPVVLPANDEMIFPVDNSAGE